MATNICFWITPPYYQQNPDEWTFEAKDRVHRYLLVAQQKYSPILV